MTFTVNKEYSKSAKASRNNAKKLRNQKKLALVENPATFICQTVHSFPSYHLITENKKALVINFLPSLKNFITTF